MDTVPAPIARALEHVREAFPEVTQVFFGRDGRWQYMTDEFKAPKFDIDVDVDIGILEAAADAVPAVPCAYAIQSSLIEFNYVAVFEAHNESEYQTTLMALNAAEAIQEATEAFGNQLRQVREQEGQDGREGRILFETKLDEEEVLRRGYF